VKSHFILGFVLLAFTACGAPELSGPEIKEGTSQTLNTEDTTPPVSAATVEQAPDANGEYHGNVSIHLTATDDSSGVASITWSLSGAQTGSGTVQGEDGWVPIITNLGTTTLTYYAKDHANNIEGAKTFTVIITTTRTCREVDLNDFNVFVTGGYTGGHDVRGKVAAGGTLEMNHFSVGAELPSSDIDNVLVAGQNLNITNGGVFGNAHYAGTTTANSTVTFYRGAPSKVAPINFEEQAWGLMELSGQLASLDRNATTQFQSWGGLFLEGSHPRVNVFWVQAGQLTSTRYFSLSVPAGSVSVINVFGDDPTIANFANNYSGADSEGVLFHFPDAWTITAYNYGFFGTVLAPFAAMSFNSGSFDGGIYAASLTGNAEGHIAPLRLFTICGDREGT
jgi:choice-of-anchor A domain-containing protein